MWIGLPAPGFLSANPPQVWEPMVIWSRNRMRETRQVPRREEGGMPLRHIGRVAVRIPSLLWQCLSTCARMSRREFAASLPERALHDLGSTGGDTQAGSTPTGTYITGVSEQ